jgi:hypothetical protein
VLVAASLWGIAREERGVMLATFGVGQVLWSIIWFVIFFMWLMLLFQVTADIFRSHDLSGASKALWLIFVLIFPYFGVFGYLLVRGGKMHEHQLNALHQQQAAVDEYIRSTAGTSASPADELHRLADLRDRGVIDDTEFTKLKARVIG